MQISPEWFYYHVPNGEERPKRAAAKLKRMGLIAGVADFAFIDPNGCARFMEIKRPSERYSLSEDQINFQAFCSRTGVPYVVVCATDEAIRVLSEWGALKRPLVALEAAE